jgi:hypothetical protein
MGTATTKSCIKDTKNGKRDLTLGGWNCLKVGFKMQNLPSAHLLKVYWEDFGLLGCRLCQSRSGYENPASLIACYVHVSVVQSVVLSPSELPANCVSLPAYPTMKERKKIIHASKFDDLIPHASSHLTALISMGNHACRLFYSLLTAFLGKSCMQIILQPNSLLTVSMGNHACKLFYDLIIFWLHF